MIFLIGLGIFMIIYIIVSIPVWQNAEAEFIEVLQDIREIPILDIEHIAITTAMIPLIVFVGIPFTIGWIIHKTFLTNNKIQHNGETYGN